MGVNSTVIPLLRQAIVLLESPQTQTATPSPPSVSSTDRPIAWGAKVSQTFRDRIFWIAETLELNPDDLMGVIAFESGRTFSASVKNMAGSGATGLLQFMPATAISMGTTTAKLAQMSDEDQLNFVYRYLKDYRGKLNSLEDTYMAVLWPKAVGKPLDYVLFSGGVAYRQNSGLDVNKDGKITKAEAAAKVRKVLQEGLKAVNLG